MSENKKKVKLNIKGKLKGMIYTFFARRQAKKLGLTTHSINFIESGHVEFIVEGEKQTLWEIIHWSKKGPVFSLVDEVIIEFTSA